MIKDTTAAFAGTRVNPSYTSGAGAAGSANGSSNYVAVAGTSAASISRAKPIAGSNNSNNSNGTANLAKGPQGANTSGNLLARDAVGNASTGSVLSAEGAPSSGAAPSKMAHSRLSGASSSIGNLFAKAKASLRKSEQ